jgi:DNA-binding NarL/FixJ family response regulator
MLVDALAQLLRVEFDVVGIVGDGRELLKAASELLPDLVVVDIGMPLLNGLDAAEQLRALHPEIRVIFLTQNREPLFAVEAFRTKASGYLLKNSAASELTAAIRAAMKGEWYASRALGPIPGAGTEPESSPATLRNLTRREREVLQLLAEGKSMKEVAAILNLSPRTIEFHKYRIMNLLRAKTGAELVQYAIKHGLIAP